MGYAKVRIGNMQLSCVLPANSCCMAQSACDMSAWTSALEAAVGYMLCARVPMIDVRRMVIGLQSSIERDERPSTMGTDDDRPSTIGTDIAERLDVWSKDRSQTAFN